jgi:hypothetical protein
MDDLKLLNKIEAKVLCGAWLQDNKTIVTWGDKVRYWDTSTGKVTREWDLGAGAFNLSRDGKKAVLGNGQLTTFDVATGKPIKRFDGADYPPPDFWEGICSWSPDDKRVATVQGIWDSVTGKRLFGLESYRDERLNPDCWSPDGRSLVYFTHTAVGIADPATGKLRVQLVALPAEGWLAVSPSGHYRGLGNVSRDLRFVVETDAGQETLTEQQFADKCGWKNDPDKVRLLPK